MKTENLSTLKINKLKTQAQYDAAFAAGKVNSNEIYLTPDTSIDLAYGVCNTAAGTAAKTVTIENFVLKEGATIIVKFTNKNSVASPTLNVSGTGAKPIYVYGTTAAGTGTTTTSWVAGAVQMLVYDGTGWVRNYWSNTTYSNASLGQGYAICDTAAATVAKTVSLTDYTLTTGGIVTIKFTHDVPANATLNINSKGAKAIYYRGAKIPSGVIKAGDVVTFMYSSYYYLIAIDRWQEDINSIDAVTIDIDDAAEGTAMGINANQLGGYNVDQFLRKGEIINADQLSGYTTEQFLRKDEEIDADTFNNHTIDYFITKPEAGEVLSDAMLKTGGEFVGNVAQAAGTRFDFKSLNGAKLRIIGYTDSDIVAFQAVDNQGNWITDILTINSATGAILDGGLMPKTGGTFTGGVQAYTNGRASDWTIKNSTIVASDWSLIESPNQVIVFARK